MRKLICLCFLSIVAFGSYAQSGNKTDAQLKTQVNADIKTKTYNPAKMGAMLDTLIDNKVNKKDATHGTVTSVALSLPSIFSLTGSPITTAGTLAATLATQTANRVFAGPTTGSPAVPAFRALVAADIPDLSGTYTQDLQSVLEVGSSASIQTPLFFQTDEDIAFETDRGSLRLGRGFSYIPEPDSLPNVWFGQQENEFISEVGSPINQFNIDIKSYDDYNIDSGAFRIRWTSLPGGWDFPNLKFEVSPYVFLWAGADSGGSIDARRDPDTNHRRMRFDSDSLLFGSTFSLWTGGNTNISPTSQTGGGNTYSLYSSQIISDDQTPTIGHGTKIGFKVYDEDDIESPVIGASIGTVNTDVTPGAYSYDLVFSVQDDGSAPIERFRIKSEGDFSVNGQVGTSGYVLASGGANAPPTWINPGVSTVLTDATTSRTISLTDVGKTIQMTNNAASEIHVPDNGTTAFANGSQITIIADGSGGLTVVADGSASIDPTNATLEAPCVGCPIVLQKLAGTQTWKLYNGTAGAAGTIDLESEVTGILPPDNGGTGVDNGAKTITLSGNATIGSSTHTVTLATSANTSVTLPTSGTLSTLAGSETLTNKTLTSPTITGPYVLDRATPSTAGGTITLDMNSQYQRMFVGSASFASSKNLALSNTTNSLVFSFSFTVTNVAATLVCPATFVMSSSDWNGGTDTWTPPGTGQYEMGGSFDGTVWIVKIAGPVN